MNTQAEPTAAETLAERIEIADTSLRDYLSGYAQRGKADLELLATADWRAAAQQEVNRRILAVMQALDADTLALIASDDLDAVAIVRNFAGLNR